METALCHVILTTLEESNFLAFAVLPLEASVSISKLTQALQWWQAAKRCTAGQVILNLSNNQRHQNNLMPIPVQYPHSCSFAQLYTALPSSSSCPQGCYRCCTASVCGLLGYLHNRGGSGRVARLGAPPLSPFTLFFPFSLSFFYLFPLLSVDFWQPKAENCIGTTDKVMLLRIGIS